MAASARNSANPLTLTLSPLGRGDVSGFSTGQDLARRIFCSLFSRQKVQKIGSPWRNDGVQGGYIEQRGSRQWCNSQVWPSWWSALFDTCLMLSSNDLIPCIETS